MKSEIPGTRYLTGLYNYVLIHHFRRNRTKKFLTFLP